MIVCHVGNRVGSFIFVHDVGEGAMRVGIIETEVNQNRVGEMNKPYFNDN